MKLGWHFKGCHTIFQLGKPQGFDPCCIVVLADTLEQFLLHTSPSFVRHGLCPPPNTISGKTGRAVILFKLYLTLPRYCCEKPYPAPATCGPVIFGSAQHKRQIASKTAGQPRKFRRTNIWHTCAYRRSVRKPQIINHDPFLAFGSAGPWTYVLRPRDVPQDEVNRFITLASGLPPPQPNSLLDTALV